MIKESVEGTGREGVRRVSQIETAPELFIGHLIVSSSSVGRLDPHLPKV